MINDLTSILTDYFTVDTILSFAILFLPAFIAWSVIAWFEQRSFIFGRSEGFPWSQIAFSAVATAVFIGGPTFFGSVILTHAWNDDWRVHGWQFSFLLLAIGITAYIFTVRGSEPLILTALPLGLYLLLVFTATSFWISSALR
tara:strand:- start:8980 stop:9408 length:429 start_codon:yes stop_codon:yes gene_type:complete